MNKKAKLLRGTSKEQLNEKLKELRKELLKMNSQIAVGTAPESPGKVKQVKKEIARIITVMNEPLRAVKKPEAKAEEKAKAPIKGKVAPQGAAVKARERSEVSFGTRVTEEKKQEVSKSQ